MRAVVTRVAWATVTVDNAVIGAIETGLLVLLGVAPGDGEREIAWMTEKIAGLRVFEDDSDRMNLSITDVGGAILLVSQFTLYGDARRGRRPSFTAAAPGEVAEPIVAATARAFEARGLHVEQGRFGADMKVDSRNDGPVTLILDTPSVS